MAGKRTDIISVEKIRRKRIYGYAAAGVYAFIVATIFVGFIGEQYLIKEQISISAGIKYSDQESKDS